MKVSGVNDPPFWRGHDASFFSKRLLLLNHNGQVNEKKLRKKTF
jgi:hypothetical protein